MTFDDALTEVPRLRGEPDMLRHIADLTRRIAEQRDLAEARRAEIAWRDMLLEEHAQVIAAQQALLAEAEAAAEQARAEAHRTARVLEEAQGIIADLRGQLEATVRAYVNSTSWTVTRPLRAAVRLARGGGLRAAPVPPAAPATIAEPAIPEPRTAKPQNDEPQTSRPAEADYSLAVPFGYLPRPVSPRIAVICHLFYPAMAQEVLSYLRHLPVPADLMLSTDSEAKRAALQQVFGAWESGRLEIRVTPNRGRDIAPKLIGFADRHDGYDLVLHLHAKRSDHADFLAAWRSFLFENLAGSPAIVASILDAFDRLPDLGMVASQHYEGIRRWLGWNGNFAQAQALARRMGLTLSPTRALDFPSGSMFWARPAALRPLLDLGLSFEDFPAEGGQVEATPAHAIERLYFHVCERSGFTWVKVGQRALFMDSRTMVTVADPQALSRFMDERGVRLGGPAVIATRAEPAPLMTRVPPGLSRRLAARIIAPE